MLKSIIGFAVCLLGFCNLTDQLCAQPNPPGTGANSIQMFQGGTQNVWIAVYPPTTYVDGTPIPSGTPVKLKVYRSMDGGTTYGSVVSIESGGSGRVGQGAAGSRTKPWIDAKLSVPVDQEAPYMVYLAVSAIVGGDEGPATNSNLTFRYYPSLVRFAAVPNDEADDDRPVQQGPLNGTCSLDGGSITIKQNGKRVTGSVSVGGQVLATLSGTFANGVYSLNAQVSCESTQFSVPVTISMNGKTTGTVTVVYEGTSTTRSFVVSGRSIQLQG